MVILEGVPAEDSGTDLEETPVEDPETGLALETGGVRVTGRGPGPEKGTAPVLKEAADAAAAITELDKHNPIDALRFYIPDQNNI